jgi:hypothetical protein
MLCSDVIFLIYCNLDFLHITRCLRVSKTWYNVGRKKYLWSILLKRDFEETNGSKHELQERYFKQLYRRESIFRSRNPFIRVNNNLSLFLNLKKYGVNNICTQDIVKNAIEIYVRNNNLKTMNGIKNDKIISIISGNNNITKSCERLCKNIYKKNFVFFIGFDFILSLKLRELEYLYSKRNSENNSTSDNV